MNERYLVWKVGLVSFFSYFIKQHTILLAAKTQFFNCRGFNGHFYFEAFRFSTEAEIQDNQFEHEIEDSLVIELRNHEI